MDLHLKYNFLKTLKIEYIKIKNMIDEFDGIQGCILVTTNCLMRPRETYKDRIFTTSVGARPGRSYYTEIAQKVPQDCVILTLACGKYRFNKLNLN